ncbi:unnamed protein product [Amoebophrya sp. A25]|nr:unnamed protein product [Amoebophrya sp. A25]|eukprot:GSA25T00000873001.1
MKNYQVVPSGMKTVFLRASTPSLSSTAPFWLHQDSARLHQNRCFRQRVSVADFFAVDTIHAASSRARPQGRGVCGRQACTGIVVPTSSGRAIDGNGAFVLGTNKNMGKSIILGTTTTTTLPPAAPSFPSARSLTIIAGRKPSFSTFFYPFLQQESSRPNLRAASKFCMINANFPTPGAAGAGAAPGLDDASMLMWRTQRRFVNTNRRQRVAIRKYHYIRNFKKAQAYNKIPIYYGPISMRPATENDKRRTIIRHYLRSPRIKVFKRQR